MPLRGRCERRQHNTLQMLQGMHAQLHDGYMKLTIQCDRCGVIGDHSEVTESMDGDDLCNKCHKDARYVEIEAKPIQKQVMLRDLEAQIAELHKKLST